MTDLELRALSIRCPLCSAHPQALCIDERGNKHPASHMARVEAYQRSFVNPRAYVIAEVHTSELNPEREYQGRTWRVDAATRLEALREIDRSFPGHGRLRIVDTDDPTPAPQFPGRKS